MYLGGRQFPPPRFGFSVRGRNELDRYIALRHFGDLRWFQRDSS
jgi:hypothetical protein